MFMFYNKFSRNVPYPLAYGYTDLFVLHKDVLYDISYTNGVFSSMNMWVEIAVPTSIVLNVEREDVRYFEDNEKLTTNVMWSKKEIAEFSNKAGYDYKTLCDLWDENCIFAHPIKLSKWDV